jgi:3-oxoadipate enol-lactonase
MARAASQIIPLWFSEAFVASEAASHRGYLNMMARTPDEGYVASCMALRDGDLTEHVGAIEPPALVLTGELDAATPPELGRGLAAALPNARFELIAGAGHLPCVEQPDLVARLIRAFLQEQGYV